MCDENSIRDMVSRERGNRGLTRRQFSVFSVAAGAALSLPGIADALDTTGTDVVIETPDGLADGYFVHPTKGSHPGVLIWPDAIGLRPAFRQMAKRLAASGYSVLVVNPYYRTKKAPIVAEGASFADEATRNTIMGLMATLTAETQFVDANAFVGFLDRQAAVDKDRKVGTMGYCMGGAMTLRTAAALPLRVGAGASFHGGRLVTDATDSPHLLVPRIQAQYLFAIAENDDQKEPETKGVLAEAFAAAELPAEIEVYEGTLHGWCPPDSSVYDEAQAERAWSRLLALFANALG